MIINVDYICHVTIIHFEQNILGILNIHLWPCTASYDWSNSMPIMLHCNYLTHSVHKEMTL